MTVYFANPWLLLLLWPCLGLGLWWILSARSQDRRIAAFMSAAMQEKLSPHRGSGRSLWQAILLAAGITLGVVALARPQWGEKEVRVFQKGRDLVIALDVSRSMLAKDVHPNRLERAKADLMDLIRDLNGDRAGLLAFRNKSVLLCPLTTDYAFLKLALDAASVHSAPRGSTNIGDAIRKSLEALDDQGSAHKAILLISDGEDLEGQALEAAREAGEKNIPIFTVGIGHPGGSRIPGPDDPAKTVQHDGKDVVTRLDNQALNAIAEASNGRYIAIQTASTANVTLGTLYNDHLRKISRMEYEETLARRRVERYQLFLLPAVLFLVAAAVLSRGRLATRRTQAARLAAIALLAMSFPRAAQSETNDPVDAAAAAPARRSHRDLAWRAQKQFKAGAFDVAAEVYQQAAADAPAESRFTYQYNAAVSRYHGGRHQEAVDLLSGLTAGTQDPEALRAYGSALYRLSAIDENSDPEALAARADALRKSGEAFMAAARILEKDPDLEQDLAAVMTQLPAARQQAKVARLLAEYADKPTAEIAGQLLQEQRSVLTGIEAAYSNRTPDRIQLLEAAAAQQETSRDLWIPLRQKLMSDMSGQLKDDPQAQQKLAELDMLIDATQDNMDRSARELRDMDPECYDYATRSEAAMYQLWKGIASSMPLLQEDIRQQTNLLARTRATPPETERDFKVAAAVQAEAQSLTGLFKQRFTAEFPETPPPGQTNQQMTAETRQEILDLTDQAIATQEQAGQALTAKEVDTALRRQHEGLELLKKIEELMPKDNQEQQDNSQQQPQQQPEPQDPQQQKPDKQDPEQQPEPEDATPEDVQRMLDKALQREKEHEAEKRKRAQAIQVIPGERDW